ncbi:MAG: DNA primase [Deinococcales bacterium]|nr:DNA primase [Deinococcales bacterium]
MIAILENDLQTDTKELIRQRLDIAEVIGEMVSLKPAGRSQLKGLCPFHNEKTPSFHVHQDRGFFYCFGCQARGDVFDFVMRTRSLEFFEALHFLGQRAGIEVEINAPRDRRRRDLFEINRIAAEFFRTHLKGEPLEYLQGRGLSANTISSFELGYAPKSWDDLLKFAVTKGVPEKDLLDAGLIVENERGRRYDRFRDRVMFPIRDYLGRTVGFSGRVIDDGSPKYLNTSETEVFKKAELLYGLDVSKAAIRAKSECIVVEGYMDVIALQQVGLENVVATLGTTLTPQQALQLSRLDVQRLFLAFDADEAGQRAVLTGLEQSVGRQFLVSAISIPAGKDPADAVLGGHLEEFKVALRGGISEVEYRFSSVLEKHESNSIEGKRAILNELLPSLRPRDVFDPVATEMRRRVVDYLGIEGSRLDDWLNSQRQAQLNNTQARGLLRSTEQYSPLALIEIEVIALLLLEPDRLKKRLQVVIAALPPGEDEALLREFEGICIDCEFDDQAILMRYRERPEAQTLFERLLIKPEQEEFRIDIDGHIEKSLSRLRELYLDGEKETQRARLIERMNEVNQALTDPDLSPTKLEKYYKELGEINTVLAARDAERRLRTSASHKERKR